MADQFCLKWNNYQLSLTSAFKHLLEEEDFVDVTLSAEGKSLKAHKVVLSACSTYFRSEPLSSANVFHLPELVVFCWDLCFTSTCRDLLRGISNWQHPVLVLRDVPFLDLQVRHIIHSLGKQRVRLWKRVVFSFTCNNHFQRCSPSWSLSTWGR